MFHQLALIAVPDFPLVELGKRTCLGDVSSATAPAKAYAPSPALRELNQVI
jgi:hypothetical protein